MVNRKNLILLLIIGLFILTRFMGLGQIYHQDEYRWAAIANPFFSEGIGSHPPINRLALGLVGAIFGYNNLRLAPFLFSIFNFLLIYLVSLKLSGNKKVAYFAVGLFTVNVYSLISNLQIDIDGAILPFFVLLSAYAYYSLLEKPKSKLWLAVLVLAVAGGFLAKLSFILFVGAVIIDQVFRIYGFKNASELKKYINKLWPWAVGLAVLGGVFYYFYSTRFEVVIEYAKHFQSLNFSSRAYFDLIFKIFKSFVWLSPLLALPVFYGIFKKDILDKYRLWLVYLLLNLIFYLVLFDFSTLTIERYFMFLIVPSVLIGARVLSDIFSNITANKGIYFIVGAVFILMFLPVVLMSHDVIPLNPKTAYLDRVKFFDFDFLIPFTGGSGPVGFYFSAWFIILIWLVSIISLVGIVCFQKLKTLALAVFIVFGVGYNIIFSVEYLSGFIYGSVNKVAKETVEYVNSNDAITGVITYYDIGAYYLRLSGKYDSRFYTAPKRDYTEKIEDYRGHYMIVDFPAIGKNDRYWPLISKCPLLKKFQDKKVESHVFDCTK